MTILKRKYTNKAGEVVEYSYDTKQKEQTNAKLKREHLKKFIKEHKAEIDELNTKIAKISFIMNNIDNYKYSYSMIYRFI